MYIEWDLMKNFTTFFVIGMDSLFVTSRHYQPKSGRFMASMLVLLGGLASFSHENEPPLEITQLTLLFWSLVVVEEKKFSYLERRKINC